MLTNYKKGYPDQKVFKFFLLWIYELSFTNQVKIFAKQCGQKLVGKLAEIILKIVFLESRKNATYPPPPQYRPKLLLNFYLKNVS